MASIEDLAAGVRAALTQAARARAAVLSVAAPIEEAGRRYALLGEGSQQPDLANSAASLRAAYEQCRLAVAILDRAADLANSYLASIIGTHSGPTLATAAGRPGQPVNEPWRPTRDQVEKLRGELPPPIPPSERGSGRKTHGRWVDADGVARKIVSGDDRLATAAAKALMSFGFGHLYVADHAEMKLAAYLRQRRESTGTGQHATIVLNNRPCPGSLGCAELLPVMLPEGCSLTVYAPDYRRTFTGGATP